MEWVRVRTLITVSDLVILVFFLSVELGHVDNKILNFLSKRKKQDLKFLSL